MDRYFSINSWPNVVSSAPPPCAPPGLVATTGSSKQEFISSTSSQARRYDILSERPASEIEPVRSISSSNRILPGPSARSDPKSTRTVSRMLRTASLLRLIEIRQVGRPLALLDRHQAAVGADGIHLLAHGHK